jgi:glutathione S-transferase
MLALYRDGFWISPYVFSCFVALKEKGLEFEVREVALQKKAQLEAGYAERSVTGRVPSLEHDRFVVAESSAIVEYLEDAFPGTPAVMPKDAKDRARARQIMAWIRSDDTFPIREERPTSTMFYELTKTPFTAAGTKAVAKLVAVTERLLAHDARRPFGVWSVADADLAFMLQRLLINGDEVPANVKAYAETEWQRPSVRAFVEQKRMVYVPY